MNIKNRNTYFSPNGVIYANSEEEHIIGIDSMTFFDFAPGTFFVYFGRPTCSECQLMEKHLENFLREKDYTVYYFNTAYWRDQPRYDLILDKYRVTGVPVIVRMLDGEWEDAFLFDPDADAETISEQLALFFGEESLALFPVTVRSYPVQFDARMHTFTFLLMLAIVLFLLLCRKELVKKKISSVLIVQAIQALF